MRSGGISYDCLTTSRKFTLPSVESWGTNMNIIKDPNKGIFTKRKDKVGDTQEVLLAQDASGDRIAECINVYARGVNPMVSVSYDNYGNNSGSKSRFGGRAVHLPYKPERIIPPQYRQEDLMPLSRQPREWFYVFTNPELPNVVQQMSCTTEKSSIESKKLDYSIPSNKQYIKELPQYRPEPIAEIKEAFHAKDVTAVRAEPSVGSFHSIVDSNRSKINHNSLNGTISTIPITPFQKQSRSSVNVQKNIRDNLLRQMVETKKSIPTVMDNRQLIDAVPHKNVQEKKVLQSTGETTKIYPGLMQNNLSDHSSTGMAIHDTKLNADASTNKVDRSSLKYYPQFVPQSINSNVKPEILHSNVSTNKYSSMTEIQGDIQKEVTRNIVEPLQYSHMTNKNMGAMENIRLDPTNIPTKQTICVPVDAVKTENIFKRTTPIDLATIPVKKTLLTSAETFKSPGEKDLIIGERPHRDARVLKSSVHTDPAVEKTQDHYDLQNRSHDATLQKNIDFGQFDPKPQAVSQPIRPHLNKQNDSSINQRYMDLQNNVQIF